MKKKEVQLRVAGMTCDSCADHVRKALASINGVIRVELQSWKSKTAKVLVRTEVSEKVLEDAVKRAGYEATVENVEPLRLEEVLKKEQVAEQSEFDLAVIGTGGAGMAAALRAVELGYKVAIIEKGAIGGTCVNIGCVPSKTLMRVAETLHKAKNTPFNGLAIHVGKVNWQEIVSQKDELVATLRKEKYLDVLSAFSENIQLIKGQAVLTKENEITIDSNRTITASRVVIASGARPRILKIPGISDVEVLTSTSIMALDKLPASLLIIGGRSIALELGQIFSRLGSEVTILQRSNSILPEDEPEITKLLTEILEQEGLKIHTGIVPEAIKRVNGHVVVVTTANGEEKKFAAEKILMAVGRVPNTEKLGLDAIGVRTDERGFIEVDTQLQTSNPKIYAAGDVTTLPKFVYVAAASGQIAAENALTNAQKQLDLSVIPRVTFTDPQVATVGLTEQKARLKGFKVKTSVLPLKHVPRALAARDTRGVIKLVVNAETDQLLGAHVLAAEAGEIIQTAAIAITMGQKYGLTVTDLRTMLFPYLTQVEGIKLAALALEKDISRLSCCAG